MELSCIEIDAETGMICARILPADAEPDQELLLAAEGEEKDCQNWLDQPLGRSETDLRVIEEFDGRLHKSQLITFLNRVQMEISGAQLAGSALFRGACGFGKEITMRDLVSTYSFPNTLAVKLVSGKVLKAYLEKCAEFWALNGDRIVVSERFEKPVPMYFNYDMVDGVSYTIDVSRPVGSRIVRLETAAAAEQKDGGSAGFGTAQNGSGNGTVQQGCTVTDDMEFTLAVNNYRAAGGGDYDMVKDAPTLQEIQRNVVEINQLCHTRCSTILRSCLKPSPNIVFTLLRHDGVTDISQLRKQVLAHGEPHLMVTFILPLCSRLLLAQLRQRLIDLPFHLVELFDRVARQVNVHPADVPCDVMLPPHCYCHPLNHSTRFISVEPSVLIDPTAYGFFVQCHSTQRRRQQIDLIQRV